MNDESDPEKSLVITGDLLIFLLIVIVIIGGALVFSIARHNLCISKPIDKNTVESKTVLEENLGEDPGFDFLACRK